jgi:pSer/pThr/pTyr-binding forkhead associated (FHA) protein
MANPKRPAQEVDERHILQADDPRPQRVAQIPVTGLRKTLKKVEDFVPTSHFDTEADQEMQAQYGNQEESKPVFLYVERGPGAGQLLELKQGIVVVGRASVSDLRVQHPSISRRHAQVRRSGEQFFVKDLGSQNGTFVNKQRIAGEVEVKANDTLAMGNALFRLRGGVARSLPPAPPLDALDLPEVSAKNARVSTAVIARKPTTPSAERGLKIAVLAGALGFGLAGALAFALVKSMKPEGEKPAAASKAPTPTQKPSASTEEKDRLIAEAIKRKMAEAKPVPPPAAVVAIAEAEPSIESDTAVVVNENPKMAVASAARPPTVKPAPVARPTVSTKAAPKKEVVEDEEPAPAAQKNTQILAAYEKGNAEESLKAAKAAGDKALTDKLSKFVKAYDAANDAMLSNNASAAIANFQKALTLDEQLSSGWGKYGAEIRRQLANIYTLVGIQHANNGDDEKAKTALIAALKHDPNNQRAKSQLAKLGGSMKPPAAAADDAFNDEAAAPAPKKAAAPVVKKAKPQSIDDAFGD